MKTKDRIAQYLQHHPEGADDGEITRALEIMNRASTNEKCHQLVAEGYVRREQRNGTLHNYWLGLPYEMGLPNEEVNNEMPVEEYQRQWYWEGNVQKKVVEHLLSNGYHIISQANTHNHERGIDIITEKNYIKLWISVKGYPRKKIKTNPRLQCVHWFSSALYDMIKYRESNKAIKLGIALPHFERYVNLAKEITWFKASANFNIYWVFEDGHIELL